MSCYKLVTAEASCGCAGPIPIPPVVSMTLGATVLLLLGLVWCVVLKFQKSGNELFRRLTSADIAALSSFAGILCGGLLLSFFQISNASFPIKVPRSVDAGELQISSSKEIDIEFESQGKSSVTILGNKTSCVCVSMQKRGVIVAPKMKVEIPVRIEPKKAVFFNRIVIFLDSSQQRQVEVNFVGFVK